MFHISNSLVSQLKISCGNVDWHSRASGNGFSEKSVSEKECHFLLSFSGIGQHTWTGRKQRIRRQEVSAVSFSHIKTVTVKPSQVERRPTDRPCHSVQVFGTHASMLSRVQLVATPWTVTLQAPLFKGFFQARILEWVATSSPRGSSWHRDQSLIFCVSCIGRRILYLCTTWATLFFARKKTNSLVQWADWQQKHFLDQGCDSFILMYISVF